MRTNETHVVRLTNNEVWDTDPDWQPIPTGHSGSLETDTIVPPSRLPKEWICVEVSCFRSLFPRSSF